MNSTWVPPSVTLSHVNTGRVDVARPMDPSTTSFERCGDRTPVADDPANAGSSDGVVEFAAPAGIPGVTTGMIVAPSSATIPRSVVRFNV